MIYIILLYIISILFSIYTLWFSDENPNAVRDLQWALYLSGLTNFILVSKICMM